MKFSSKPDTSLLNLHFGGSPHKDEKPGMAEIERWDLRLEERIRFERFLEWAALQERVELLQRRGKKWWNLRHSAKFYGKHPGSLLDELLAKYWNIDYKALLQQQEAKLAESLAKIFEPNGK